jgi:hypothetical protein
VLPALPLSGRIKTDVMINGDDRLHLRLLKGRCINVQFFTELLMPK